MRDLAAIPFMEAPTRHHAAQRTNVLDCPWWHKEPLDKTVDDLGTNGGQRCAHPHLAWIVTGSMGTSGDNRWTTTGRLTSTNDTLSTIHRAYYHYYCFQTNKPVSTTGSAELSAVVRPTRPTRRSLIIEKNRENQR